MSRAAIPVLSYKNKTANLISHLGTAVTVAGVLLFGLGSSLGSETMVGIGSLFLLGGLACIGIVWLVMKQKSYDTLIQKIKENNLEPVIASSTEEAIKIYKLNPGGKMKKYISSLNPEAGNYISKHPREFM